MLRVTLLWLLEDLWVGIAVIVSELSIKPVNCQILPKGILIDGSGDPGLRRNISALLICEGIDVSIIGIDVAIGLYGVFSFNGLHVVF